MVQIIQEQRRPSTAEMFGQAFARGGATAGKGYAKLMGQREENEAIKRLTGKDLSGLSPEKQKLFLDRLAKVPEQEALKKRLIDAGATEEEADLFHMLSPGAQTEYFKGLMDKKKRGMVGGSASSPNQQSQDPAGKPLDVWDRIQQESLSLDEGLTPAERVARGKERYSTNLDIYQKANDKLRAASRDKDRLDMLQSIVDKGGLPKGVDRMNLDGEGNLRLPFLASDDAQRYVKIINEFTANAKDTYGSRVTNFDLQQYLKRFPTLLNSQSGIKKILKQMKIVNQINSIYNKNLKKVYDKAGGVRKIDADLAERYADEISEPEIQELVKKFDDIDLTEVDELPDASKVEGKIFENPTTGEKVMSDGKNWIPL